MKKILLPLLLAFCFSSLFGQVVFDLGEASGTQNIPIDVKVYNFDGIAASQFSIEWNEENASFASVGNFNLDGLNLSNFGQTFIDDGLLTHSWIDPNVTGISVPDGTTIFTIYFNALNSQGTPVFIANSPTPIEFVDANFGIMSDYNVQSGFINGVGGGTVSGNIFKDNNANCVLDADTDPGMNAQILTLSDDTNTYYTSSDDNGDFSFFVAPGSYNLATITPNAYWATCETAYSIDLLSTDDFVTQDVGITAIIDCPVLSVDLGTPFIRRCFDSYYRVSYCNDGTIDAEDAYVDIELDEFLSLVSVSLPYTDNGDGTFRVDLGTIPYGDCGSFTYTIYVNCEDTELGQTHCSSAHIYPDDPCIEADPLWTGASIMVGGECDGDMINFRVINVGSGDMDDFSNYIVIEDNVMFMEDDFLLDSGAEAPFSVPANGATYRLEAVQVPGHPGMSAPSIAIEACGTNAEGEVSQGFISMFPLDEADPFISISCDENIGSYDPNDKQGFPTGFGAEHGIKENTDLTYKIRFQNTGTDTAFNIIIKDDISDILEVASVEPGASSHPYDFRIEDEGTLVFTFDNIMLPDSFVNEPASNGFVTFKIAQQPDLPVGTVINNTAAIYFDFNDPIITNMTLHTIVDDYISVNTNYIAEGSNLSINTYPNPFADYCVFDLSKIEGKNLTFTLYDLQGKILKNVSLKEDTYTLYRQGLATGSYFYTIDQNDKKIAAGQIIAQ